MSLIEIIFALALTVAGSFWGFYLNRYLEKRHLPKITAARQKAISGEWIGIYAQDENDNRERKDLSIVLRLDAGPRLVNGLMIVSEETKFQFHIEGSFYHNKYLRLNYIASGDTEYAIDFGSIFLVLGDYPNKMTGKLAGYGSISEALISGSISLEKNITAN
jgi:hypothetical protein